MSALPHLRPLQTAARPMAASAPAPSLDAEPRAPSDRRHLAWPVRWLDTLVKAALVLCLLMVLLFTVGQVADRYVLKSSFDAHDQFARLGLVWLTFLGIAVGIRDRTNVRVEVLNHLAPPRVRRAIAIVLDLVILAVSVVLVIVGFRLLEVGAFQAIMGTPLNYDVMYAAALGGLGLLILFLVLRFADLLSGGLLNIDFRVDHDDHHD
ncbi:hypothetical protein RD110_20575 [Rhodoferax koreense]|uniref:TRAP transporter small permease protein n=1 Tax=Rhodoferax koreensis TaxID=1842727 RepID=A0A1P8JZY0_9BURK|nr:TRAP transporter small permease subunit [Rhodoferax koreense]APW39314.1 hypothetical protein RD110_20575 [Rhodoferax koreense]